MITFGPVPSRRLGTSLGINNIPPKQCTYSCVYCQAGPTTGMDARRREFYKPEQVEAAVKRHLESVDSRLDYLSFVPDGEPTLDASLGKTISLLKPLGIPIAVISNASLVWNPEVREELAQADWVSLKVDSVDESVWKRINRPNHRISLSSILEGIREFSRQYTGKLVTETMLVDGVNDETDTLERTAEFITTIKPAVAYVSIPTRPPLDKRVCPPDPLRVNCAYQIFTKTLPAVECLTGSEGEDFGHTGDLEQDLLNITAVHPMRQEAVEELCKRSGADRDRLEAILQKGQLVRVEYNDETYFIRNWNSQ